MGTVLFFTLQWDLRHIEKLVQVVQPRAHLVSRRRLQQVRIICSVDRKHKVTVQHLLQISFVIDADLCQVDHTELLRLGIAGINIHVRTADHKPTLDPHIVLGLWVVQVPTLRDVLALGNELGF